MRGSRANRIMMSRVEADQSDQITVPSRQPRLRRYLKRRARQLSLALLFLAIGLLFIAGVVEVWRRASLIGLRDVGDPFDVAAFRSFLIPADQDALVPLREIEEKITRMPHLSVAVRRLGPVWSKALPEFRDWLAANHDVLEIFRDAAERPDGMAHPTFDRNDSQNRVHLGGFAWLALLEASRLEEQGDMAGAWNWYRAVFRVKNHVTRRGSIFQRYIADRNCKDLRTQIALGRRPADQCRAAPPSARRGEGG